MARNAYYKRFVEIRGLRAPQIRASIITSSGEERPERKQLKPRVPIFLRASYKVQEESYSAPPPLPYPPNYPPLLSAYTIHCAFGRHLGRRGRVPVWLALRGSRSDSCQTSTGAPGQSPVRHAAREEPLPRPKEERNGEGDPQAVSRIRQDSSAMCCSGSITKMTARGEKYASFDAATVWIVL